MIFRARGLVVRGAVLRDDAGVARPCRSRKFDPVEFVR